MRTRRSLFLALLLVLFLPVAQSPLARSPALASEGCVALADCSHGVAGNDCAQEPTPGPTSAPTQSGRNSLMHPGSGANTSDGLGLQLMAFAIALAIWLKLR